MEDIRTENDEDRFEMFDLSMSVVTLLDYIRNLKPLKRYFNDLDSLSSKVREDCNKEKSHVVKIKQRLRKLEDENDSLRKLLQQTYSDQIRYRRERDDVRNEMQRLRHHRKRLSSNVPELEEAEEELNQLRQDFERQRNEYARKVKELDTASNKIIDSQKKKIQHFKNELDRRDLTIKELEEMLYAKTTKPRERTETKMNMAEIEEELSSLRYHLQQTLTKLDETERELEETKTRLSKAMGDRLTDNNPNIADLSDKNRPTKLAERYTELYDNQWTDAFDSIDRYFHREEDTIATFLKILQDAMTFCNRKEREQMDDLQRVLKFSDNYEHKVVSSDVPKPVKDCRKSMSSFAVRNLYKMYLSYLRQSEDPTLRTALDIGSFTKECIEICWLMVIQDPPIVFAPAVQRGSRFNTDLYKPYTSSGTHVGYVVWPTLLLHKDGPVLAKGVAQGYRKKSAGGDRYRDSSIEGTGKNNKISSQSKSDRQRFPEESNESPDWSEYAVETTRTYRRDGQKNKIPLGFDLVNPYYNYVNVHGWERFRNGIGQQTYERTRVIGNKSYR
ncbi:myosin-3-like [Mercenaria mercenaria]|uniref:myosin-3-like n=1 Tax=Mercenaria mercenaria TaxID=6596 RepID=UPI00234F3B08|nr:myosin-3-like [Mercenaria mercenaria]XP_045206657.2 myosin-3-like [Mercenaria mercenaria]